MNTDSFVVYLKIDDIYKDIAEDIESRFDTVTKRTVTKRKK